MTKEELAVKLNGSEYPLLLSETSKKEIRAAGLVVVYESSYNLMVFDGAICDEVGSCEGTTALVSIQGAVS